MSIQQVHGWRVALGDAIRLVYTGDLTKKWRLNLVKAGA
jgi:hypothetical protein